jgi:STE24 endopeptidase
MNMSIRRLSLIGAITVAFASFASNAIASSDAPTGAKAAASASATTVELAPRSVGENEVIREYQLTPERRARAERAAYVYKTVYFVNLLWFIVAFLLMLRLRVAPKLVAVGERMSRKRVWQTLIFGVLFTLLFELLALPIDIWEHVLDRGYGLSVQGWGSFARDWSISGAINVVTSAPFLLLIYWVLRRSPRRWWLWTWIATLPIRLFLNFAQPMLIDPLYYRYTPLATDHPALAERLHAIAIRRGVDIPPARIFEMNASTKLRTVNAFARGYGGSKRIIVWDTSLQAMNEREISFLFGHELGHYVEGHLFIAELASILGLLLGLFAAGRVTEWVVRRRGAALGIPTIDSLASLPLLILIGGLLSYVTTPTGNAMWRYLEHRADAFGLAAIDGVVDDPQQAAAHMLQRLGEIDLTPPNPKALTVFWFYGHPPLRDRIRFVLGR